jgi:peptidoglycan hydrolase-like protein with peptidoglycan-binding domain
MATYSRNRNSQGDQVTSIQETLNALLFQLTPEQSPPSHTQQGGLKLDGIFGARTEYCVIAIQKAYNLSYKLEKNPIPPEDIEFQVREATTTQPTPVITDFSGNVVPTFILNNGYEVRFEVNGPERTAVVFENGIEIGRGDSSFAVDYAILAQEQASNYNTTIQQRLPSEGQTPVQQSPPYSTTYSNDQVSEDQFQNAVLFYLRQRYWDSNQYPVSVDEDGVVGPEILQILNLTELPVKDPDRLIYTGRIVDDENVRIKGVELNITNGDFTAFAIADNDGVFRFDLGGNFDPSQTSIEFDAEDYFPKTVNNVLQSAQENINGEVNYIFELGIIRLTSLTIDTNSFTKELLINVQKAENREIKIGYKSTLSLGAKIGNFITKQKEKLKRLLIPLILGLLAKFGAKFLRKILDGVPNPVPDTCPTPEDLLELIRKRNALVKQLNKIYKIVEVVSKVLKGVRIALIAIKIGFQIAKLLPIARPSGLIADGVAKIKLLIDKSKISINFLIVIVVVIGILLQTLIDLLNKLDGAIQHCAEDDLSNISFEQINDELNRLSQDTITEVQDSNIDPNSFENESGFDVDDFIPEGLEGEQEDLYQAIVNDVSNIFPDGADTLTGILDSINNNTPSNSTLGGAPNGNTFRGFTFEIQLDPKNTSKYPKRFAQALNISGVPVLISDSSFASNPQVLIDQLKFIIESQGLRGD